MVQSNTQLERSNNEITNLITPIQEQDLARNMNASSDAILNKKHSQKKVSNKKLVLSERSAGSIEG